MNQAKKHGIPEGKAMNIKRLIIMSFGLMLVVATCMSRADEGEKEVFMIDELLSELKSDRNWVVEDEQYVSPGLKIQVSSPIDVAFSEPDENRWGYHQFPAVSRLPDGRLLATYSFSPDYDDGQGFSSPAMISADGGLTWTEAKLAEALLSVPHSVISEVEKGEYLCIPRAPAFDITARNINMPEPIGELSRIKTRLYDVTQCHPEIGGYLGNIKATRWTPSSGQWVRENVSWDTRAALARMRNEKYVFPSPSAENTVLRLHGRLYTPDYNLQRLLPNGAVPRDFAAWCLVSEDNGVTWKRIGLIAYDSDGRSMMAEPCLAATTKGNIVCVIRTATWKLQPLLITRSSDKGVTWEKPKRIYDFGVMPQIILLPNGVHALSSGRPGVYLMFSTDGEAMNWSPPLFIVEGNRNSPKDHSCGYTRMLAVNDNSFLLIYADFKCKGPDDKNRRVIRVRRISVERDFVLSR